MKYLFLGLGDVPKNTDEDMWTNPNSMNLLFDLEFPRPAENTTINIVAAKLRLYKMSQVSLKFEFCKRAKNQLFQFLLQFF